MFSLHLYLKEVGRISFMNENGLRNRDKVINQDHNNNDLQVNIQKNAPETWHKINHVTETDKSIAFDYGWKFSFGEQANASGKDYDDSSWQSLDLPHDFSLIQDYTQAGEAESGYKLGGTGWYRKNFTVSPEVAAGRVEIHFDGAYMETEVFINGTSLGVHPNGYSPFTFDLTEYIRANEENTLAVKVVNPTPSSRWYSGSGIYRSVNLNVTPKIHLTEYGVVVKTPKIQETVQNNTGLGVEVATSLVNDGIGTSNVRVKTLLFERAENGGLGNKVAEKDENFVSLAAKAQQTVTSKLSLANPKLWSVADPNLYIVRTEVYQGDKKIQSRDQETGFRLVEFDKDRGFKLNGQAMKLQGVSMHHDQGGLGAKAYYDAIERQFEILKDMGVNAVRVTHNPAARAMKDIANRKGMLLIDEAFDTWEHAKNGNTNDYARYFNTPVGKVADKLVGTMSQTQTWAEFHVKQMVKSGINDPSIIMWSTGNEVMEGFTADVSNYPQVIEKLMKWVEEVDTGRPSTLGDNKLKEEWPEAIGMADVLTSRAGIVGFNYAGGSQYDKARKAYPNWIIYGSETVSSVNSRGVYDVKGDSKRLDKQLTSYDQSTVPWGHLASEAWYDTIVRDFVAGEFVWTGFDYLGEPTPWNNIGSGPTGGWPSPKSSYFGIVDTAGFPKDSYYFYRSQWNKQDTTLHLLPAWDESVVSKDNQNQVEVVVYSNAAKVQLIHIDHSGKETDLGTKEFTKKKTTAGFVYQVYEGIDKQAQAHKNLYLTWNVVYQPGQLKAIAFDEKGQEISQTVGRNETKTFSAASQLATKTYKQPTTVHNQSLVYVEIAVQDGAGSLVANATNPVTIKVEGPARLVAMDNGNAVDHQSYQENNRKAFGGKVLAILQLDGSSGKVTVSASSPGLTSSCISFDVTEKAHPVSQQVKEFNLSKTIYIQPGTDLHLPETIKVRYSDQSEETKKLIFDAEKVKRDLATGKTFTAHGRIEDLDLSVDILIAVIEQVVAMKNISQAVEVNTQPSLPSKVQGFLADGSLLSFEFPVTWQMLEDSHFAQAGTVLMEGKADVLGQELPVTASVRVGRKTVIVDQNVASSVSRLTQSVSPDKQSGTLAAVKDGVLIPSNHNDGGANPTIWSTYKAAQAGQKKADLTFTYATAQNIGQVVAYYHCDKHSLRNPKSVSFAWSADGLAFERVAFTEVKREVTGTVTKITYDLVKAVPAVAFQMTVENADKEQGMNVEPAVAIVKLELNTVLERFDQENSASINQLILGNKVYGENEIKSEMTLSGSGDLSAHHTEKNPGITILKLSDTTYKIFAESEDKSQLETYHLTVLSE